MLFGLGFRDLGFQRLGFKNLWFGGRIGGLFWVG